jgi:hypothetical protein
LNNPARRCAATIFAASTFDGFHAVFKALSFARTLNAHRPLWPFPEQFAVTLDESGMLELREPRTGRVSSTVPHSDHGGRVRAPEMIDSASTLWEVLFRALPW